jgi:ribonucleoside-diphosphate reductase beta chain
VRLDHDHPALREFHKAKRLMWDPRDVDLAGDKADWPRLTDPERDTILQLCSLFLAGEEAVTTDLAPLLLALRGGGGCLEEELFLTTQLFEEAKHVEFFDRWLREVVTEPFDPAHYQADAYRHLFYHELPTALDRLLTDTSTEAQVDAIATYHMIVEGVLAETGYYSLSRAVGKRGQLRGLVQGMQLVQRDEARHIAFGIGLLERLIGAEPRLMEVLVERMNHLLPQTFTIIGDTFAAYGEDDPIPFGLDMTELIEYAATQFSHRLSAIERRAGFSNSSVPG